MGRVSDYFEHDIEILYGTEERLTTPLSRAVINAPSREFGEGGLKHGSGIPTRVLGPCDGEEKCQSSPPTLNPAKRRK
jgi:hypothetical protein